MNTTVLFDPAAYTIDGIPRGTSKVRATYTAEYEPGTDTAEQIERLRLGETFQATITVRVAQKHTAYKGPDNEAVDKITILEILSLAP